MMVGTVGYLRDHGVTQLVVYCVSPPGADGQQCHHRGSVSLEGFWAEVELASIQGRLRCSKCGSKEIDVRPDWATRPARESLTGVDLRTRYQPGHRGKQETVG